MDKTPSQVLRELFKAQGIESEPNPKAEAIFYKYTQAVYDQAQNDAR